MNSEAFPLIALALLAFTTVSGRLANSPVTPPMIFATFGLAAGAAGLGLIDLRFDHGFIHTLAEITLILVLFSDAAGIDLTALRRDYGLPARMLGLGMPLIIAAGTAAAYFMPLGLTLWEAALLAAILAPTDAALGQSVVSSPTVPAHIRRTLNVESGLNDGIALPMVALFACLASLTHGAEEGPWLLFAIEQITLGPLAGIAIGWTGGQLIDRARQAGWMSETYSGPAVLALAFLSYAGAEMIGGNGFIAAFVGGLVFGNTVRHHCHFLFEFAEAEGQILVLLTFLIFGAIILPHELEGLSWPIMGYAVLSLTVLRMIPIALSLLGTRTDGATKLFLGWFGPRGLASMLFALFVLEEAVMAHEAMILNVTIVTVALSILAHGVTAAPFARLYGRGRTASASENGSPASLSRDQA